MRQRIVVHFEGMCCGMEEEEVEKLSDGWWELSEHEL
jgi:hypothetical protein